MITCNDYDFIEIACLYQFSVELTLNNGATRRGTAIDTAYDKTGRQCLVLRDGECAGKHENSSIFLDDIYSMRALTLNPHFSEVIFTAAG